MPGIIQRGKRSGRGETSHRMSVTMSVTVIGQFMRRSTSRPESVSQVFLEGSSGVNIHDLVASGVATIPVARHEGCGHLAFSCHETQCRRVSGIDTTGITGRFPACRSVPASRPSRSHGENGERRVPAPPFFYSRDGRCRASEVVSNREGCAALMRVIEVQKRIGPEAPVVVTAGGSGRNALRVGRKAEAKGGQG